MENELVIHKCENEDIPLVNIVMFVYNHAEFIEDAIKSILMQQTQYSYRIVIGEDCSTDTTRRIIMNYYEQYSNKMELYLWKKNVGGSKNGIEVLKGCKGKYIAVLEGDDLWTDPLKLEKQISFLENHEEYIGTAHNVRCVDRDGKLLHRDFGLYPIFETHIYGKEQAERFEMVAQSASLVYRNIWRNWSQKEFDDFFLSVGNGDIKLNVLLGMSGDIYFFRDIMADHRRVFEGDSWTAKSHDKNMLWLGFETCSAIQKYMKKYQKIFLSTKEILQSGHENSCIRLMCKCNKENLEVWWKFFVTKLRGENV